MNTKRTLVNHKVIYTSLQAQIVAGGKLVGNYFRVLASRSKVGERYLMDGNFSELLSTLKGR